MPSKLDNLLKIRDSILKDIQRVQNDISGTSLDELKNTILLKQNERSSLINEFKVIQNSIVSGIYESEKLLIKEKILQEICKLLSELDKIISVLTEDFKNKTTKLNTTTELNKKLNDLLKNLEKNTELIGKEREQDRLNTINENNKTSKDFNFDIGGGLQKGLQKVWIDENLGVYMIYDKVGVISQTMKCFFKATNNIDKKTLKNVGYENGLDSLYENISQVGVPGLPSLLSVFIDLIIKGVGNFAKNFFAFKNTIDLLAGMQIGELLGTAIPGIGKVLEDLKLFFSDTKTWLFKNLMGPLFDINIPIPSFKFDLGAIIPMLPFKIPIPGIDPYNFLNHPDIATPFNPKSDQSKVPLDWMKQIMDKYKADEDVVKNEKQKSKDAKISDINKNIEKLKYDLDIQNKINDLIKNKDKYYNRLKYLISQLDIKKIESKKTSSQEELLSIEKEMEILCQDIAEEEQRIKDIENQINNTKDLTNEEKQLIQNKINELEKQKKDISDKPIITSSGYTKIANTLRLEQGIVINDLDKEIENISNIGVNVFDYDNLQYIQKLGYNFKNSDHKNRLIILKEKGIKLDNTKLLMRLYNIGLNINDPNFGDKLDNMNICGININDTKVLSIFLELGFNFNHNTIFQTINGMNSLGIDMNNYDILLRLNTLGFNFNDPEILKKIQSLKKYVDIKTSTGYDNAISRNVNFNNPNFISILESYNTIGLSFNDSNFIKNESNMLSNVSSTKVQNIIDLFEYFETENKNEYYRSINLNIIQLNAFMLKCGVIVIPNPIAPLPTKVDIINFKDKINIYSEYGFIINELNGTGEKFTLNDNALNKYKLLKKFVEDSGWKINGTNIKSNNNISEDDLKKIAKENGLKLTNSINAKENEISIDAMKGLYGNFNKLGLNIRDKKFNEKFDIFQRYFNIEIDSAVILDTTRHVYLDTNKTKVDGKWQTTKNTITIDLGEQKPDPDIYDEKNKGFANIRIENYLDPSVKNVPTKTMAKFDSLNQIGYNFQKLDYSDIIIKLSSLGLDINKFETVDIINSFISIGFHLSDPNWKYKLKLLTDIGFNLNSQKTSENNSDETPNGDYDYSKISEIETDPGKDDTKTDISISTRLDALNNIGFNFYKDDYVDMLIFLKDIGINFSNKWFDNAITELNNFGINFNDIDWKTKSIKFKEFNINFSVPEWIIKISNLTQLGIDFNGDWLKKYTNANNLVSYGLDYNILDLREKLAILLQIGVDFDQPEDTYKEQIESLIDIGLVTIKKDKFYERKDLQEKYIKSIQDINRKIQDKQSEIDGSYIKNRNNEIEKLKNKSKDISEKIEYTKLSKKELEKIDIELLGYCKELTILNDKIKKLEEQRNNKQKEIDYKGIEILKKELLLLIDEKNKIEKPKPYKLKNYKISFSELDKFNELDSLNLNFYDPDWKKNIKKLVDAGFSFDKPDWKQTIKKFTNVIGVNQILEWRKTIINLIKSIVSMPLKTVFAFIKKLIDLIKSVIGVPVNPTKIPDYAKKLIKKFKDFIEMIKKLPTMEGMLDFLFMKKEGLTLVDIFLPGFSTLMQKIKTLVKDRNSKVDELKKKSTTFKNNLIKNKKEINDKINKKLNDINIKKILINGDKPNDIKKLENKKNILSINIEKIKNIIKNSKDLSKETISELEKELQKSCIELGNIDNNINDNENKLSKLNNKPLSELENELNDLKNDKVLLKSQNDYDNAEKELKEAEDTIKLGNFCQWSENIGPIITFLNGYMKDIENEPNKEKTILKNNSEKIIKLESDKKELENLLNIIKTNGVINNSINPETKNQIDNLNKLKKENTNDIIKLEKYICENKYSLSDSQFNEYMNKLNDLNQLNKNYDSDIENKTKDINDNSVSTIKDINNNINRLNNNIDKLKKENVKLEIISNKNELKKQTDLFNLDKIIKWLPVVINIVCCGSPMICNIIIGIINSVGYMKYLPTLFNFDYV
ncbi:hypothetical protein M0Q50_02685 [bacterium]|jgi:hypothetical protein|nr:hypothetical protein [bacterium]